MRGFAFVDLCRQTFDVVVMNPPYGAPARRSKDYCRSEYKGLDNDLFSMFMDRSIALMKTGGITGALTPRTWLQNNSYSSLRGHLLSNCHLQATADLGFGVLDTALVETAASVFQKTNDASPSMFARLTGESSKEAKLLDAIKQSASGNVFWVKQRDFQHIEGSPFVYWLPASLRNLLGRTRPSLKGVLSIKQGLATGDDFRFIRASWEVGASNIGRGDRWVFLSKGGEYSPWFFPVHLVVDWEHDGDAIRNLKDANGKEKSRYRGADQYFVPGLTYPFRTVKGFNARSLPADCLFTIQGPSIVSSSVELRVALGFLNSRICRLLLSALTSSGAWQVGYLQALPYIELPPNDAAAMADDVGTILQILLNEAATDETTQLFTTISHTSSGSLDEMYKSFLATFDENSVEIVDLEQQIDQVFLDKLGFSLETLVSIGGGADEANDTISKALRSEIRNRLSPEKVTLDVVSYSVGVCLGRWDSDYIVGRRSCERVLDAFATLPAVAPGGRESGRTSDDSTWIDCDGILVDDPGKQDDIVRRVREVLEVIWKGRADAIEKEAFEILGVKTLRDYFRKPGKGGFWSDHVSRYSKSRRKAPIYWLLQSSKKNYGLWLYYHRLDKDMLFKALLNYVDPKIQREENRLSDLRSQKSSAGDSDKGAKKLDRQMEKQEDLLIELRDFEEKLRKVADLHLVPDLNDGVVLNIAPLHELVPWKEAKKYWNELMDGKYEWSSIGKQLREKGLVK
jgi:hypothetical protein